VILALYQQTLGQLARQDKQVGSRVRRPEDNLMVIDDFNIRYKFLKAAMVSMEGVICSNLLPRVLHVFASEFTPPIVELDTFAELEAP
jgi:hypothetical protein